MAHQFRRRSHGEKGAENYNIADRRHSSAAPATPRGQTAGGVGAEAAATDGGVSELDASAEADTLGDLVVLGEVDPVDPGRETPGEAAGRLELARVRREAAAPQN
jgi:hypothetical protein